MNTYVTLEQALEWSQLLMKVNYSTTAFGQLSFYSILQRPIDSITIFPCFPFFSNINLLPISSLNQNSVSPVLVASCYVPN